MVSHCVSLWVKNTVLHTGPVPLLELELCFQPGGDLACGYGQCSSSLPCQGEPCTSGIISLVITCLTGRLRGFNEIMFVKLFELLRRINDSIQMQNVIIITDHRGIHSG